MQYRLEVFSALFKSLIMTGGDAQKYRAFLNVSLQVSAI